MTLPQANAFLERYRDAFNRFDAKAVTDQYALPCIYSQGATPAVFSDHPALLDNNVRLVEFYEQDEFERSEFSDLKLESFGERHALLDVQWTVHRRTPKGPVIFRTAYNLRCFDNDWKIWAVTVYEERKAFELNQGAAHASSRTSQSE